MQNTLDPQPMPCVCRFDHSPCDPTVTLKGSSSEQFACVACGQHFQTMDQWNTHLQSKVSMALLQSGRRLADAFIQSNTWVGIGTCDLDQQSGVLTMEL